MTKELVSAKLSPVTKERLDEYADNVGISRSEAVDRLVKQGLDIEESDMRLVPVKTDGSGIEQNVSETQNAVEGLRDEFREFKQVTPAIVACLFWIGATSAFNLPSLWTIGTGIVAIVILVLSYAKVMYD